MCVHSPIRVYALPHTYTSHALFHPLHFHIFNFPPSRYRFSSPLLATSYLVTAGLPSMYTSNPACLALSALITPLPSNTRKGGIMLDLSWAKSMCLNSSHSVMTTIACAPFTASSTLPTTFTPSSTAAFHPADTPSTPPPGRYSHGSIVEDAACVRSSMTLFAGTFGSYTRRRACSFSSALHTDMADDSRVSLVSALNAKPSIAIVLSRSELKKEEIIKSEKRAR
mmetsp:Transcript_35569/g.92737  ORF Transcript_35569/g.92737 Transcript_35569/m.92737 type:complete len:225 (+) Transcript_35569:434-1108(+)